MVKRVNDETERSGRLLGKACIGVVIGLSLIGVTRVSAQERDTARTNRAVLAPSSSDSGVCAALAENPTLAIGRLQPVLMKAMQSPEVQALFQSAAEEEKEEPDQLGKAEPTIKLSAIDIPDSLRAPLIDAITRGAFDSARAIGQKFIAADDKLAAAQFAFMLENLKVSPEELRPLITRIFLLGPCPGRLPAAPRPSKPSKP